MLEPGSLRVSFACCLRLVFALLLAGCTEVSSTAKSIPTSRHAFLIYDMLYVWYTTGPLTRATQETRPNNYGELRNKVISFYTEVRVGPTLSLKRNLN